MAKIRLTTLGRADLTGADGRPILSVLSQPKRFALLVYLTVEGSGGLIRRDNIAALFWPERDQADARANLRKSIYFLRQSLGQDVILTRTEEEVGVDSSLLECDVVALLSGAGDPPGGNFLDGFHFSGAPVEWEDWLQAVRQQARVLAPAGDGSGSIPPGTAEGEEPGLRAQPPQTPAGKAFWRRVALGASALAVLLTAGLIWALSKGLETHTSVEFLPLILGSGVQSPRVITRHYALPPDGSGILFRDTLGGRAGSWWKALDRQSPSYMPEFDRVVSPVFSPDLQWIVFVRNGNLLKQSRNGAITVPLVTGVVSTDFTPGVAWLSSGDILFENVDHDLMSVPARGGDPVVVATRGEVGEAFQASGLPDGNGALVVGCDGGCETGNPRLSLVDFRRDTVIELRAGIWKAWPMPDGRVVTVDSTGTVFASRFDPGTGSLGQPIPLLEGVKVSPFPEVLLGADGSLLYAPGGVHRNARRLAWVGRHDQREWVDPDWTLPGSVGAFSLSPDGRRLALEYGPHPDAGPRQIWIKDLPSGAFSPLTVGPAMARRPVWTPDGGTVVFITQFEAPDSTWKAHVTVLPADASSPDPVPLVQSDALAMEVVLSNDGRTVVVRTGDAGTGQGGIAYVALGSEEGLKSIPTTETNLYSIDVSPDGRWLAYVSEVSGRPEVYVRPFPGPGPRVQVSQEGGVEPRWAHNGRELFFRSSRAEAPNRATGFMAVARVTTGSTLHVDSIDELFSLGGFDQGNHVRLYDVSADDRRFLLITPFWQESWSTGEIMYSRGWYWSDEVQARLEE